MNDDGEAGSAKTEPSAQGSLLEQRTRGQSERLADAARSPSPSGEAGVISQRARPSTSSTPPLFPSALDPKSSINEWSNPDFQALAVEARYQDLCAQAGVDPATKRYRDVFAPSQEKEHWKSVLGTGSGRWSEKPIITSLKALPVDLLVLAHGYFPAKCRNPQPCAVDPSRRIPCGRRWCSAQCFKINSQFPHDQLIAALERDGLLDRHGKLVWFRYTSQLSGWAGLDELRRLRPRFAEAIRKLRIKYPGLRSGWFLDWTPEFYPDGSRPHDVWIIVVPEGVDRDTLIKTLVRSVKHISERQKVALLDEPFCEVMKNPRGAIGYITGFKKGKAKITLPPEPPDGRRLVSYDLRCLVDVSSRSSLVDDGIDENWDVEIDGNRFRYLQRKRWKSPAEKREFAALQEACEMAGGLSFTGLDVPTRSVRRGILSAFKINTLRRFSRKVRWRWVPCSPSEAVEKSGRRMHIRKVVEIPQHASLRPDDSMKDLVDRPKMIGKFMPYGGEPVTGVPADHVLVINLNIGTDEGQRRADELHDLLEQHTRRRVFRRVSGGKTGRFHHLQLFVIGLTPDVKEEWVDVVEKMREKPGCEGFRVHLDEAIRMPLSPAYWRTPTMTEYGVGYRVNDSRVASFDFPFAEFAREAEYYAEDLSRCEGAGMPPADLPRRARPESAPNQPQDDRAGARAVYTVRRATSDDFSIEVGASTVRSSSGSGRDPEVEEEVRRDWRVSTYRGMRAWFFSPSARPRRVPARGRRPPRAPAARRSSSGS